MCALAPTPALAQRRLALSIGIDVYDHLTPLKKGVNDARAMGAAFKELGFATTVQENLTRAAFLRTWVRFVRGLKLGDTAAFFFAGHGVQIGGANYLVPRDAPEVPKGEEQVLAGSSIQLDELLHGLRDRKVQVSLLIIDACREAPFRDPLVRGVWRIEGLAPIADPPKGSFILFSAAFGQKALDRLSDADAAPNSPFTRTLLPILKTPGLSMPEIATRVRKAVYDLVRSTNPKREQVPAYYDGLLGDFMLKAGVNAVLPPLPLPLTATSEAERAWAAVKDGANIAELEAMAERFKGTKYADLARARIGEVSYPLSPRFRLQPVVHVGKRELPLKSCKVQLESFIEGSTFIHTSRGDTQVTLGQDKRVPKLRTYAVQLIEGDPICRGLSVGPPIPAVRLFAVAADATLPIPLKRPGSRAFVGVLSLPQEVREKEQNWRAALEALGEVFYAGAKDGRYLWGAIYGPHGQLLVTSGDTADVVPFDVHEVSASSYKMERLTESASLPFDSLLDRVAGLKDVADFEGNVDMLVVAETIRPWCGSVRLPLAKGTRAAVVRMLSLALPQSDRPYGDRESRELLLSGVRLCPPGDRSAKRGVTAELEVVPGQWSPGSEHSVQLKRAIIEAAKSLRRP
jgi:hypothetical protein